MSLTHYYTRSSADSERVYNVEAIRRAARKKDGIIHMHGPQDECSDFEHEKYLEGERVEPTHVR